MAGPQRGTTDTSFPTKPSMTASISSQVMAASWRALASVPLDRPGEPYLLRDGRRALDAYLLSPTTTVIFHRPIVAASLREKTPISGGQIGTET